MYNPSSTSPGSSANSGAASVQDIFNSWVNALTKPLSGVPVGLANFQQEAASATQNKTIMSVGISAAISIVFSLLGGLLSGHLLGDIISTVIKFIVLFAVTVAALYVGAKSQGGTGTIEQQAWVQSTYWAPIMALGAIPIIGGLFTLVGGLYSLYLTWLSVQAVHRLDSSKSIIAMIIWAVLWFVAFVVVALIVGIILAALNIAI